MKLSTDTGELLAVFGLYLRVRGTIANAAYGAAVGLAGPDDCPAVFEFAYVDDRFFPLRRHCPHSTPMRRKKSRRSSGVFQSARMNSLPLRYSGAG